MMTRRERAIEARKLTRKLIKLTAQKIITLTDLDEALTHMIENPELLRPNELTLNEILKTVAEHNDAAQ